MSWQQIDGGSEGGVAGVLLVFIWIDVWAYIAHRMLHMKAHTASLGVRNLSDAGWWQVIYKYLHKWHHRYQPPTAGGRM